MCAGERREERMKTRGREARTVNRGEEGRRDSRVEPD